LPVTSSLYEEFRSAGRGLQELLGLYESLSVSGAEWVPAEGSPPVAAAGADSSRQYEVYRGVMIYAVQGHAVLTPPEGPSAWAEGASAGYMEVSEASRVGFGVAREALVSSAAKTLEVSLLHRLAGGGGAEPAPGWLRGCTGCGRTGWGCSASCTAGPGSPSCPRAPAS
jgi:hypothetical protein